MLADTDMVVWNAGLEGVGDCSPSTWTMILCVAGMQLRVHVAGKGGAVEMTR